MKKVKKKFTKSFEQCWIKIGNDHKKAIQNQNFFIHLSTHQIKASNKDYFSKKIVNKKKLTKYMSVNFKSIDKKKSYI